MQDPNESWLRVCGSGDSFQDIKQEPDPEEIETEYDADEDESYGER
jgi:hypothetical protein